MAEMKQQHCLIKEKLVGSIRYTLMKYQHNKQILPQAETAQPMFIYLQEVINYFTCQTAQ